MWLSTAGYWFLFAARHLVTFFFFWSITYHSVCLQGSHREYLRYRLWQLEAGELSSGQSLGSPDFGAPPISDSWVVRQPLMVNIVSVPRVAARRLQRKKAAGCIVRRTKQWPILCQGLNPVCYQKWWAEELECWAKSLLVFPWFFFLRIALPWFVNPMMHVRNSVAKAQLFCSLERK